jgi:hypothetical protein
MVKRGLEGKEKCDTSSCLSQASGNSLRKRIAKPGKLQNFFEKIFIPHKSLNPQTDLHK